MNKSTGAATKLRLFRSRNQNVKKTRKDRWLTIEEVARKMRRSVKQTRSDMIDFGLYAHPIFSRVYDGVIQYRADALTEKNLIAMSANIRRAENARRMAVSMRSNGQRFLKRNLLSELKKNYTADPDWLTIKQLHEKALPGLSNLSLNGLQKYVARNGLTYHPTLSRESIYGKGREFHVSLFSLEEVEKRVSRIRLKNKNARKSTGIFDLGEDGEFGEAISKMLANDPGLSAAHVRDKCLHIFGETIMRRANPNDRVKMPPLRTFQHHIATRHGRRPSKAIIRHRRTIIDIFQEAQNGELLAFIMAEASFADTVSLEIASAYRVKCTGRFGDKIMRRNDPGELIRMPSARSFFLLLKHGLDKVDVNHEAVQREFEGKFNHA